MHGCARSGLVRTPPPSSRLDMHPSFSGVPPAFSCVLRCQLLSGLLSGYRSRSCSSLSPPVVSHRCASPPLCCSMPPSGCWPRAMAGRIRASGESNNVQMYREDACGFMVSRSPGDCVLCTFSLLYIWNTPSFHSFALLRFSSASTKVSVRTAGAKPERASVRIPVRIGPLWTCFLAVGQPLAWGRMCC